MISIRKTLKNLICNSRKESWPILNYDQDDQPFFIFLLTLPYSGSTAISKVLNTSPYSMILQERAEGQWLIPNLSDKKRWDANKIVNLESLKSVWLNTYQTVNLHTESIDVVVEKSPPNIMRIEDLKKCFHRNLFIANNRNPYASCASMLLRVNDDNNLEDLPHNNKIIKSVRFWIERSYQLKTIIEDYKVPLITYEEFCDNPVKIIEHLTNAPIKFINSINFSSPVKVKDYKPQGIVNQNNLQISKLSSQDLENITAELEPHIDLLRFFGYSLIKNDVFLVN